MLRVVLKLWWSLLVWLAAWGTALPCTAVFWVGKEAVLLGRNMDWYEDMQPTLRLYPRAMARKSNTTTRPLEWISKYGSLITTAYDDKPTDGLNEKGLAAQVLWLNETAFGQRKPTKPGLSADLWMQYYLDNFQSVEEAIQKTEEDSFQIVSYFYQKINMSLKIHMMLEDKNGDSAIFEVLDGRVHIYRKKAANSVMTNSPAYKAQVELLKQYRGFGGDKPLPGSSLSESRFVRASHHIAQLGEALSAEEAFQGILLILQNVGQPIKKKESTFLSRSVWRAVANLRDQTYYFNALNRLNVFWVDLKKVDFSPKAGVRRLDLRKIGELSGEVSGQFEVLSPDETVASSAVATFSRTQCLRQSDSAHHS